MSDPLILSGSFSGKVSEFTREARFSASSDGKWFLLTPDELNGWFRVRNAPSSFKGRAVVSFYNDTLPLFVGRPIHVNSVEVTCSDGTLVYYTDDCRWEECSDDYIPTGDATYSDAASSDATSSGAASSDATSGGAASSDAASGDVASGDVASGDVASSDAASGDVASGDVASGDVASGDVYLRETLASIHGYGTTVALSDDSDSASGSSNGITVRTGEELVEVLASGSSDGITVRTGEELVEILTKLLSNSGGGGGGGGGGSHCNRRRNRHSRNRSRRRNRSKEASRSDR